MTCFLLTADAGISKGECPNSVLAEEICKKWFIKVLKEVKSVAVSDGGIDAVTESEYTRELNTENLVFSENEPVGVFIDETEKVLFFGDDSKRCTVYTAPEEFVGGWGDVTETYTFTLAEK